MLETGEYIVRCGWTPDGDNVWAQLLDREQVRLALVLIPVECFVEDKLIGDTGPTRSTIPLHCDDEVSRPVNTRRQP